LNEDGVTFLIYFYFTFLGLISFLILFLAVGLHVSLLSSSVGRFGLLLREGSVVSSPDLFLVLTHFQLVRVLGGLDDVVNIGLQLLDLVAV